MMTTEQIAVGGLSCINLMQERIDDVMDRIKLENTRQWVRDELERCVNFWLEKGMDKVHGGVYTCLDREGKIFSTDKYVPVDISAYLWELSHERKG